MAATLLSVFDTLGVITESSVLSALFWDSAFTFGIAAALLTAGAAVILVLPWTDQQIASTDDEARTLLQHVQTRVVGATSPRVAVVSRAS